MNFLPSLLLLAHLKTVELIIHHTPLESCDFNETILPSETYSFANENWPDTYDMGINCRWTFNCIEGYACRLQCSDVGLPATLGCYLDKLLVYTSSNSILGARVYCGRVAINLRSLGSKITLKLVTSKTSPGGRFRCTASTEKWKENWFYPTVIPIHIKLERLKQDRKKRSRKRTLKPSRTTTTVKSNRMSNRTSRKLGI